MLIPREKGLGVGQTLFLDCWMGERDIEIYFSPARPYQVDGMALDLLNRSWYPALACWMIEVEKTFKGFSQVS